MPTSIYQDFCPICKTSTSIWKEGRKITLMCPRCNQIIAVYEIQNDVGHGSLPKGESVPINPSHIT